MWWSQRDLNPCLSLERATSAAVAPRAVLAQEYPSRPLRIVSPFSPGATSDLIARALAQALGTAWGVTVVAETFIRAETAKWGAVIKASGAKAE